MKHLAGTVLLCVAACAAQAPPAEQRAWPILEAGSKDKKPETRASAVSALVLAPEDRRAVAAAEAALDDKSPLVRRAGAAALGQMLSVSSIPKLDAALRDSDSGVVLAAAKSLDTLRNPAAYEVYYAVLTGQWKGGQQLGAMATEQLKSMRNPKALANMALPLVPGVGSGYGALKMARKNDSSPSRAVAASALANDPDPRSAEVLALYAYDASPVVRAASISAIARRGDPLLLADIEPALDDKEAGVRFAAAAAILHLVAVREVVRTAYR
jgi:HEAT repeat protein